MGFPETFKALADPVRREILELLKRASSGEIASHFDMTGATISYHLSQLKKPGSSPSRQKNFIYYQLSTSVFEELLLKLGQFSPAPRQMTKEEMK